MLDKRGSKGYRYHGGVMMMLMRVCGWDGEHELNSNGESLARNNQRTWTEGTDT